MPAIATFALLGALAPTNAAHAAATCNAAPKSPPPQGSHWYYRTDRTLGRKCWYLASEGGKIQTAAPRTAAPASADAEPVTPPMAEAAARLTEPLLSLPPPAPPAANTARLSEASSAPLQVPPAAFAQRNDEPVSAPNAQEPAATAAPEPVDQKPAQAATPAPSPAVAPAPAERINLLQYVFVMFVGLCLVAGIAFYLAAVRRRRMEIRIVDLNTPAPLRMPMVESTADAPSLDAPSLDAPSLAPSADGRRDAAIDDERLRRFSQAWKRQAA